MVFLAAFKHNYSDCFLAKFQRRNLTLFVSALVVNIIIGAKLFVNSSLKFCVKFGRKAAFNVKCSQLLHVFCEATRIEPWQNTSIATKTEKSLNE